MIPLLNLSEKLSLYPRKIHNNFSLLKNTLLQKIPSLKNSKSIYLLYQNYLSKNIVTLNMRSMTSFSKNFLLRRIRNIYIYIYIEVKAVGHNYVVREDFISLVVIYESLFVSKNLYLNS